MATTLCAILVFLSIVSSVRAEVKPVLYIWPPKLKVEVCTDFEIEVRIRNLGDRGLKNYTIAVFYDRRVITAIDAAYGDFLGGGGGACWCAPFIFGGRGGLGWVTAQESALPPLNDAPGGSLFYVLFHCKAIGVSNLDFSFFIGPIDLFDAYDVKYRFDLDFDTESAEVTQYTVEDGGFSILVDKFSLLAPYLGVTSMILVSTVAAAIYVKRIKRKKEDQ
jgi:hypothetical protein